MTEHPQADEGQTVTIPKFHIRDLFWLVLVAGMGCGWWVDRGRLAEQYRRLKNDWAMDNHGLMDIHISDFQPKERD